MNRFEPKMRELYAIPLGFSHGDGPIRLTEEEIQEAERLLGARLPEDYREFVHDFGRFSVHAVFPVREGFLSEADVGYFTGIVPDGLRRSLDLVTYYLHRDPQALPDDAIPIAIGGNIPILLFFKGEKKGKVYIRDYEELCLVADSFEEFMELLEEASDDTEIAENVAPFWNSFSTM